MIVESNEDNQEPQFPGATGNSKCKVLLVDDHHMMRAGLKNLINSQEDLTVIAEASDGGEVIQKIKESSPDVIIMDVDMPVKNGIEATLQVNQLYPDMPVIGLSLHDNEEVANAMISAGARYYLSKTEAFATLCSTIRQVT